MKAIKSLFAKSATPISSHPLFPGIVALWFAALFGFGSLVLPTILIERAVSAIGLPSLIGATAPPLGFTAKLMIAACAAMVGAVLGFVIARKVAASQQPEKSRQRGFANAPSGVEQKRPISANEELGSDTFDAPVAPPALSKNPDSASRRRGLAINEDEAGPSEYLQQAPLPGGMSEASPAAHGNGFGEDDEISFRQAEAPAEQTAEPMHYSNEIERISAPDTPAEDELRFQPTPEAAPTPRQFESKQVFQPQAAEPLHQPAAAQNYEAEVQQGMPRLKVEPDLETPDGGDFGFQPLEPAQQREEQPVNPALEARLSGLAHADETEIAPTSVLKNTLHSEQAAPEITAQDAAQEPAAPLAFSPPSLGKQKPEAAPLELSEAMPEAAPEAVAEEVPVDLGAEQQTGQFDAPEERLFDLPKGFENSEPLETAPQAMQQFDPLGQIGGDDIEEGIEADDMQFAPLARLQNEFEDSVEECGDSTETDEPLTLGEDALSTALESDDDEEELPLMTDPISGQPLDALGTVELIERLAKSVRLRANSGTSQSAIAASAASDLQQAQIEQELAEQAEETFAEAKPAIDTENLSEQAPETLDEDEVPEVAFAPPVQDFSTPQEFAAPQSFSTPSASDDFVPSSLKPIDLHLDDEVDSDGESFSLPIGKQPVQPNANAPFSAPGPTPAPAENPAATEESVQLPTAPQISPFAAPDLENDDSAEIAAETAAPQMFAQPEVAQAPQAITDPVEPAQEAQMDEADQEEEEPFGSLLELRNRLTQQQQFVRVDDGLDTDEADAGEPAVVFPGQGGQATPFAPAPGAPSPASPFETEVAQPAEMEQEAPSPIAEQEQQPTAPFTSPGFGKRPIASDASQMPSAMPEQQPKTAPPAKDPAETERALRSALATLQRMSGAA